MNHSRPHWSYSAISQYLRCPLQYYFQRVLGIPSRTTSSGMALGSAVHAGLAEYHRRLMEQEQATPETVAKAFQDDWQERETRESIQFRDGDTRDDCIAQGVHLLELYLKEPPPERIVAVEHRFMAPLANSQGEYLETPLVAITDLITADNESLQVKEFKTSGRAYSESEVASSLQPTCYVHAVRECLGQEPSVEYTVLVKTKTPKVQRLQTSRYADDCGRLGDLVQTIQRAVDLGIFYPVESPMNCATCAYRQQCRDWGQTHRIVSDALPTSDAAQSEVGPLMASCST
jgi:CRISPR/Cas system-associated exonuclease Cas4 (RecB family)